LSGKFDLQKTFMVGAIQPDLTYIRRKHMVSNLKDTNIISISGLTKRFKDFVAVDNISFDVKKGEIFAFLGPNGAGKSTTIKMLTTLLEPTSGRVTINGHDPKNSKDAVRKSFGIVFQDPSLDIDMTALENLQYHAVLFKIPVDIRKKRIEELLRFVELWDRKNDMVKTFSGGMKRRLEMARGLLHHPKIIFLDEPTLGLDPQTRNHIWNYLLEVNKKEGMTIFFSTHYMEEAEKVAQRIAIIDHGRIVAIGSVAELEEKTKTHTLEEAYIALTGSVIREEQANMGSDRMRMIGRMRGLR
jgi:ABC-2 type transport system ATP-binding protein